jgi:predicted AAA+ superfamily ATPase
LARAKQEKIDLLTDVVSSYINVDVARLSDFKRQKDFYGLIKMLVGRIGSRLDYVKLSQLSGISRPSLINYLEFLEKTYLIYRVPVFTKSRDREIVKARKLYFCDTGLANVLSQISSGQQFENTVFNQLKFYGEVRYFSLKTGREIDFVLNERKGIEAKETPTQSDSREISALAQRAGLKEYFLVGRHPSPKFKNFVWAGGLM